MDDILSEIDCKLKKFNIKCKPMIQDESNVKIDLLSSLLLLYDSSWTVPTTRSLVGIPKYTNNMQLIQPPAMKKIKKYLGLIGLGHLAVDSLLDGLRFSRTVTALIDKLEQKYIDTPQALNLVDQEDLEEEIEVDECVKEVDGQALSPVGPPIPVGRQLPRTPPRLVAGRKLSASQSFSPAPLDKTDHRISSFYSPNSTPQFMARRSKAIHNSSKDNSNLCQNSKESITPCENSEESCALSRRSKENGPSAATEDPSFQAFVTRKQLMRTPQGQPMIDSPDKPSIYEDEAPNEEAPLNSGADEVIDPNCIVLPPPPSSHDSDDIIKELKRTINLIPTGNQLARTPKVPADPLAETPELPPYPTTDVSKLDVTNTGLPSPPIIAKAAIDGYLPTFTVTPPPLFSMPACLSLEGDCCPEVAPSLSVLSYDGVSTTHSDSHSEPIRTCPEESRTDTDLPPRIPQILKQRLELTDQSTLIQELNAKLKPKDVMPPSSDKAENPQFKLNVGEEGDDIELDSLPVVTSDQELLTPRVSRFCRPKPARSMKKCITGKTAEPEKSGDTEELPKAISAVEFCTREDGTIVMNSEHQTCVQDEPGEKLGGPNESDPNDPNDDRVESKQIVNELEHCVRKSDNQTDKVDELKNKILAKQNSINPANYEESAKEVTDIVDETSSRGDEVIVQGQISKLSEDYEHLENIKENKEALLQNVAQKVEKGSSNEILIENPNIDKESIDVKDYVQTPVPIVMVFPVVQQQMCSELECPTGSDYNFDSAANVGVINPEQRGMQGDAANIDPVVTEPSIGQAPTKKTNQGNKLDVKTALRKRKLSKDKKKEDESVQKEKKSESKSNTKNTKKEINERIERKKKAFNDVIEKVSTTLKDLPFNKSEDDKSKRIYVVNAKEEEKTYAQAEIEVGIGLERKRSAKFKNSKNSKQADSLEVTNQMGPKKYRTLPRSFKHGNVDDESSSSLHLDFKTRGSISQPTSPNKCTKSLRPIMGITSLRSRSSSPVDCLPEVSGKERTSIRTTNVGGNLPLLNHSDQPHFVESKDVITSVDNNEEDASPDNVEAVSKVDSDEVFEIKTDIATEKNKANIIVSDTLSKFGSRKVKQNKEEKISGATTMKDTKSKLSKSQKESNESKSNTVKVKKESHIDRVERKKKTINDVIGIVSTSLKDLPFTKSDEENNKRVYVVNAKDEGSVLQKENLQNNANAALDVSKEQIGKRLKNKNDVERKNNKQMIDEPRVEKKLVQPLSKKGIKTMESTEEANSVISEDGNNLANANQATDKEKEPENFDFNRNAGSRRSLRKNTDSVEITRKSTTRSSRHEKPQAKIEDETHKESTLEKNNVKRATVKSLKDINKSDQPVKERDIFKKPDACVTNSLSNKRFIMNKEKTDPPKVAGVTLEREAKSSSDINRNKNKRQSVRGRQLTKDESESVQLMADGKKMKENHKATSKKDCKKSDTSQLTGLNLECTDEKSEVVKVNEVTMQKSRTRNSIRGRPNNTNLKPEQSEAVKPTTQRLCRHVTAEVGVSKTAPDASGKTTTETAAPKRRGRPAKVKTAEAASESMEQHPANSAELAHSKKVAKLERNSANETSVEVALKSRPHNVKNKEEEEPPEKQPKFDDVSKAESTTSCSVMVTPKPRTRASKRTAANPVETKAVPEPSKKRSTKEPVTTKPDIRIQDESSLLDKLAARRERLEKMESNEIIQPRSLRRQRNKPNTPEVSASLQKKLQKRRAKLEETDTNDAPVLLLHPNTACIEEEGCLSNGDLSFSGKLAKFEKDPKGAMVKRSRRVNKKSTQLTAVLSVDKSGEVGFGGEETKMSDITASDMATEREIVTKNLRASRKSKKVAGDIVDTA